MSSDLAPPDRVPVVLLLSLTARRRKVDVLRRAFADRPAKPPAFLPEVHTWGDWLSKLEGIIDVLYLDEERDCSTPGRPSRSSPVWAPARDSSPLSCW